MISPVLHVVRPKLPPLNTGSNSRRRCHGTTRVSRLINFGERVRQDRPRQYGHGTWPEGVNGFHWGQD